MTNNYSSYFKKRTLKINQEMIEMSKSLETSSKYSINISSTVKCSTCKKESCICKELIEHPKIRIKSRLSPNNFKRHIIDLEKSKNWTKINLLTPSFSSSNGAYVPYTHSKKKIFRDPFATNVVKTSNKNLIIC